VSVGFLKKKSTLSLPVGGLHLCPPCSFCFPFPTFNKLHLYPCNLLGFFHAGTQELRSSEITICEASWEKGVVSPQTLHLRVSLSFFSLFVLLHCQGNRLSSVLRESSWQMLGQDPALSAQQAGLPASPVAEAGAESVCPMCAPPMAWGSRRTGRPGLLNL
jgi:hypothetical protein